MAGGLHQGLGLAHALPAVLPGAWLQYTRGDYPSLDANVEHSYGSTTARRNQLWSPDGDDLEDMSDFRINYHKRTVARKLGLLNWT